MTSLLTHFDELLSPHEPSQDKTEFFDEWTRSLNNLIDSNDSPLAAITETWNVSDSRRESVLGQFPTNSICSKLVEKDKSTSIGQSLLQILSSKRTNDEISMELAELLGFDELELVAEILADRIGISTEVPHATNVSEVISNLKKQLRRLWHPSNQPMETPEQTFAKDNIRRRMQEQLETNAAQPLFRRTVEPEPEILPHVYSSGQGSVISHMGSKYALPLGTIRNTYEAYDEVIIPPPQPIPPRLEERSIPIKELDDIIRNSFSGYATFNRVQSIVFPTAYGSNENLLICAPTGAGKTEVAMMAILRVINQSRNSASGACHLPKAIDKNSFKIIYVAPMKALAAEIVRKISKRLQWLSIAVRELTGDMQLTKAEIAQTQIIVTTPEKWDVVTRKPTGEGEIASMIKLLIIDEVHLLNDERGAVIETIVARTLRQVESSQSMIRIVGLSATLPNYRDVAEFLCVSRHKGLFYFDSSFRPIPLEQHFLGIRGKANSVQSRRNFDVVTSQKVTDLVMQGHQVMVFVHSRKETVKTAMVMREAAVQDGSIESFSCEDHPQFHLFRQKIGESRNKEMKLLFDNGFGIHHAGMLRSDRNLMEKMFSDKAIKVLCCTATLAWGVNLPAYAVIIKGTQVYNSSKGNFVDLSVLDVLQIFGRAGRPGMESSGEGYICTTEDKLTRYLDVVTSSVPIESKFHAGMVDALNAEISLGTVSNVRDGIQWLGYTYLFVRMRMNPFAYGLSRESLLDDPQLGGKRMELVSSAAQKLVTTRMIAHDVQNGRFQITELGRIAARYYIRYTSIEIFNELFRPQMSEADVLNMMSKSTEFDQIQVRESEIKELEEIMGRVPCEVKNGTDTSSGKVNILLQGFISREVVDDFALVSDMAYVAQNAGRIARALVEIAVSRKWANVAATLIGISKAIETRLWPYEHPLRQMNLKSDTLYALEKWADDLSVSELASSEPVTLGQLVHLNEGHGQAIIRAAQQFPTLEIRHVLQPIAVDILRISLEVIPRFDWNAKLHTSGEPFWLWAENEAGSDILQISQLIFHQNTTALQVNFSILVDESSLAEYVTIRAISDRWSGSEETVRIAFGGLIMPLPPQANTKIISLPFLNFGDIGAPELFKEIFSPSIQTLNTLQTQAFWNVVYSRHNTLLCAPGGSGKSTLGYMCAWWHTLRDTPHPAWVMILVPTKIAALGIMADLDHGSRLTQIPVQLVTETRQLFPQTTHRAIRVVPAKVLLRAFYKHLPEFRGLSVVICDLLEELDPAYELALSLLRLSTQSSSTRFVGISASLNDHGDMAKWFGAEGSAITSFGPKDHDQSLTVLLQSFSIPYSSSLFKAMAKPAFKAIRAAGENSSLVFVSSRGHARFIAQDLITQCTLEMETAQGFAPMGIPDEVLHDYSNRFHDVSLKDFVTKGVGFFYPGLERQDRALMLEMFAEGTIRVLIVPKDSCWSLPLRARIVIVMGTQYARVEEGASRLVKDYTLLEIVRMQSHAMQQSGYGHFHLFCPAESFEMYSKLLDEGLPLESQLHESHILKDWARSFFPGDLDRKQLMDVLSFTFLAQRLIGNPFYYGYRSRNLEENLSRFVDRLVEDVK